MQVNKNNADILLDPSAQPTGLGSVLQAINKTKRENYE